MQALTQKIINTQDGEKTISVHACDIRTLDVAVDVMTVSAFYRNYAPTRGTLFGALADKNIDIHKLSVDPEIDLREPCNIWLSRETPRASQLPIRRVGCIEMSSYSRDRNSWQMQAASMLASVQAYFRMLDIASIAGIPIERIVLPILGTGNQQISADLIMTPMLNECVSFLKNNHHVRHIMIVTYNQALAFKFGMMLEQSYAFRSESVMSAPPKAPAAKDELAFISYSSKDKNIADNLCAKLEARGIRVWYAPRDISAGDYAGAIVDAITRCTKFVVILSRNSMRSNHVLNEIDLAFNRISGGLQFLPLKMDEEELGGSFMYYLSRQHWMDAHIPPLEKRLEEFADRCCKGAASAQPPR